MELVLWAVVLWDDSWDSLLWDDSWVSLLLAPMLEFLLVWVPLLEMDCYRRSNVHSALDLKT